MSAIDWFVHDRFGMFVHFGLYSQPAGVWKGQRIGFPYSEWLQAVEKVPRAEYRELAKNFNPTGFDADAWIRSVRDAGMKYFVITSKHHDGFALWPTKVSDFNITNTPFGRDILGELAAACAKYEVKLGFYYSHWLDWEGVGGDVSFRMENDEYVHPTQEQFTAYWEGKCLPQICELIDNYNPALFWFDTWDDAHSLEYIPRERQEQLIALIREKSKKCLINGRIQYMEPSSEVDFMSSEDNYFPEQGYSKPWETSGTLNDSWGYHQLDFSWKSTEELLKNLIGNAAIGGNYQLNVGPTGEGIFQPAAKKRLTELGSWLAVNGQSIYGTERNPLSAVPWGKITTRTMQGSRRLYLHLWDVTPGEELRLEVSRQPIGAYVLETGQKLEVHVQDGIICLALPAELRGLQLPVVALDVKE